MQQQLYMCKITRRGLELREKIRLALDQGDSMRVINLRAEMQGEVVQLINQVVWFATALRVRGR